MHLALHASRHGRVSLSGVSVPAVFVAGKYDVLADTKDMRTASERIDGATYRELLGTHFLPLERPGAVAQMLRDLPRRRRGLSQPRRGARGAGLRGAAYAGGMRLPAVLTLLVALPLAACGGDPDGDPTGLGTPAESPQPTTRTATMSPEASREPDPDPATPPTSSLASCAPSPRGCRRPGASPSCPTAPRWSASATPPGSSPSPPVGPGPRRSAPSTRPPRRERPACWVWPSARRTTRTGWSTPTSRPPRTTASCG